MTGFLALLFLVNASDFFFCSKRLCQIGDRILPQIIHDTRTEGDPAIVHGTGHFVGALTESAGALLVGGKAVQGFDDIEEPNIAGIHTEGETAGWTLA